MFNAKCIVHVLRYQIGNQKGSSEGQQKRDKQTYSDLQYTTQKTKNRATLG